MEDDLCDTHGGKIQVLAKWVAMNVYIFKKIIFFAQEIS